MNDEIFYILENLGKERNIAKEIIVEAVEAALASAARKALHEKTESIEVKLDTEAKIIHVYKNDEEIKLPSFGRIAAQTAKQVMMQKIREAERDVVYNEFLTKIGNITNGVVHRFEKGSIVVDLGKAEGVLPKKHLLPKEMFKIGDRVRAVILEVKKTTKGPQIVLSRTSEFFVQNLFELEVPEIYEEIVKVKAIARQAGERTKIAVYSSDDKIDSVGACVGMRGARVKNIVKELKGEKIDIIRWSPEITKFVESALSPAEIVEIKENQETGKIDVVVEDNQLSLAIGKRGQNVRLASRIIGREIDIKSQTDLLANMQIPITELPGLTQKVREALINAELDSVTLIAKKTKEELMTLDGIGEKTAEKIVVGAKEVLEQRGMNVLDLNMKQPATWDEFAQQKDAKQKAQQKIQTETLETKKNGDSTDKSDDIEEEEDDKDKE